MRKLYTDRRGITAVEVVVVLVIIIIIAAILYPVFSRSTSDSPKLTCQGRLKELAIAIQVYWNDYDGHLPSSVLASGSKKWNKRDFRKFAAGVAAPDANENGKLETWTQIIYPHVRDKDILLCPRDSVDPQAPSAKTSYWWKLAIDKAWYGAGCAKPCRKESDFIYNADQIVIYERKGWHFGDDKGLKNDVQINVAYLDTHVRTVSLINAGTRYKNDPAMLGEPAYFNFDNLKPKDSTNPPKPEVPANHVDPNRYSDSL